MGKIIYYIGFIAAVLTSCTMGFSNTNVHVPKAFENVYIPSAKDESIYAGQSARLSFVVRDKLSRYADFNFTSIDKARWALEIKILNKVQKIVTVDTCNNPGNPTVASGAYECAIIHPEITTGNPNTTQPHSFNQPSVSPSTESTMLYVQVRAIDLNTGAVMWAKNYSEKNLSVQIFNEIGDPGDGRTMSNMKNTPNLHALRYREAVDNSVSLLSERIAADIENLTFAYFSSQSTQEN